MTVTGSWEKKPGSRWQMWLVPDWQFFSHVSMTDPFYLTRLHEFLAHRSHWGSTAKVDLMEQILHRFTKEDFSHTDFEAIQEVGNCMLECATYYIDHLQNFANNKDEALRYIEVIRRLIVDWIS